MHGTSACMFGEIMGITISTSYSMGTNKKKRLSDSDLCVTLFELSSYFVYGNLII